MANYVSVSIGLHDNMLLLELLDMQISLCFTKPTMQFHLLTIDYGPLANQLIKH